MLFFIVLCIVALAIIFSFLHLFSPNRRDMRGIPYASKETLILLLLIYLTLVISFAVLYCVIHLNIQPIITEGGELLKEDFFSTMTTSVYYSAVTMLTVGYGDVTPIGIGRGIAIIQALLGYVMPAAFVVRIVLDLDYRD
ncbi:ion channel [Sutcliffiella cohnii]